MRYRFPVGRSRRGIFIKYRSPSPGDGAGAQIQRILGLYGAARSLDIGYVHSPIVHLGSNPGDSFKTPQERQSFLSALNAEFSLQSDLVCGIRLPELSVSKLPSSVWRLLPALNKILWTLHLSLIIALESPYAYVDQNPDVYELATKTLRFGKFPRSSPTGPVIVDVHIRRTLSPPTDEAGRPYERHLSTDWYFKVLEQIHFITAQSDRGLRIRVHTDRSHGDAAWVPSSDTPSGSISLWRSIDVFDSDGSIRYNNEDFNQQFNCLGEVEMVYDIDPISAWKMMVESDILVTGPSSFSFVAGLLRGNAPVISPNFWHQAPSWWLVLAPSTWSDSDSSASTAGLIKGHVGRAIGV